MPDPVTPGMDPNPNPSESSSTKKTTTTSDEVKGSFQDRVNQLTRRTADAERVTSATVAENSELKNQLTRLEQQIAQLSSRSVPAASRENLDLSVADQPANFDNLAKQITEEVLGAVKPVLDEVKQGKADTQLAAVQQASFNKAAQVHPELRDPDSALFKTFGQLWDGRPELQRVEGAPELLVEAARGLLVDEHATEQVKKMAAAADTPRTARQIESKDKEGEDISEAISSLTETGTKEGWDQDEFGDFLSLKFRQFGRQGQN